MVSSVKVGCVSTRKSPNILIEIRALKLNISGIAQLHAKNSLDSTDGDNDLPQARCVEAMSKVVDYLHLSYEGGDVELGTHIASAPRLEGG
jgi:hypothetical protein